MFSLSNFFNNPTTFIRHFLSDHEAYQPFGHPEPIQKTKNLTQSIFDELRLNASLFSLPDEVWKVIFDHLNVTEIFNCSMVNVKCYGLISDAILSKKMIFDGFCINPSHWNQWCGDDSVSLDEFEKAFRLLPHNINEILKMRCPIFRNKRIIDVSILVWVPEKIKGLPLNLKNFEMILKQLPEFSEYSKTHASIDDDVMLEFGSMIISSGWLLMLKEHTHNQDWYNDRYIRPLKNSKGVEYRIPNVGELIICMAAFYLKSKKGLFTEENESIYTIGSEKLNDKFVYIGNFKELDFKVTTGYIHNGILGRTLIANFKNNY